MVTALRRLAKGEFRIPADKLAKVEGSGLSIIGSEFISRLHFRYNYPAADTTHDQVLDRLEKMDRHWFENIKNSDVIFLTLGTATYLTDRRDGEFINNSSGLSKSEFDICRLTVEEMTDELVEIYSLLQSINPSDFDLIVTVSPQRYAWYEVRASSEFGTQWLPDNAMDGIVFNNGDKARLRVAVDEFVRQNNSSRVEYFPSFDIVMDELRQQETLIHMDHLHISPETARYVMDRFLKSHCSQQMIKASKIGIPAASYGALSPAFKAYPILIVGCVIACIPFPYLAP